MTDHCDPAGTTLYLGIDWTEQHRLRGARKGWAPYRVEAPLCDPPYQTKQDYLDAARARGLKPPRLYELGFKHANCGGGCVRAGVSQWTRLYHTFPERFAQWERDEQMMRDYLDADVAILRDQTGGTVTPLTLATLRARIEADTPQTEFDWGGCGCFLEEQ